MHKVFCSFCGVPVHECDPQTFKPFPWHAEVRAIHATLDPDGTLHLDQASVTGIGMISHFSKTQVVAPPDIESAYADDGGVMFRYPVVGRSGLVGFAVHDACWQVLMTRLRQSGYTADPDVVRSIFRHLRCTPCPDFSAFAPDEEYGGAEYIPGALEYIFEEDPFSSYYACPSTLPSLDELENMVQPTNMPIGLRPNTSNHTLKKLPLELVYRIFSYVPYDEVVRLRLVCRD